MTRRRPGEITGPTDFMDLLGLGDVRTFDPTAAWRIRPARDRLRVPIGLGEGGALVHLDIKESAQQGMGPHGLVIGATGSGKSEFLRTLVLGLAMTHSPEQLNMVLVDFKGGATFAGMSEMPHVSAVITNLAQELTLVDRMQDALSGEMVRRQELLREAGNFASIRDYEKARAAGEDLAPMPSLFIVVDEFSEMLSAKPEFIDLFVAIGRLGRSLGLHLLLASQRLEEGRLRGLESHLSYRIGLRTFSAQESRAVLGVPDAYELPAVPGLGYLKPDPTTMTRFKAAYVSGPPASGRARVRRDEGGHVRGILPFTISEVLSLEVPSRSPSADAGASADRDAGDAARRRRRPHDRPGPAGPPGVAAAARRARHPRPAHGRPRRGPRARPGLAALARARRARRTRSAPSTARASSAATPSPSTSAAPPATSPSSAARAAARARCCARSSPACRSPRRRWSRSSSCSTSAAARSRPLASLPHVAGVGTRVGARRRTPDRGRGAAGVVDRREAYFRANGIDSIETYRSPARPGPRRRRLRRRLPRHRRVEHAALGLRRPRDGDPGAGLARSDLRPAHRHRRPRAGPTSAPRCATCSAPGSSCKLGDAMDSEIDRKVAQLVPAGRPGPRPGARQAALPRRAAAHRRRRRPPTPSATASTT